MTNRRSRAGHRNLTYEQCEDRALLTLIFVLNGNAYSATSPSILTANAAQVLDRAGNQAVQISTPGSDPFLSAHAAIPVVVVSACLSR